jgi:hypothetical protein
MAKESSKGNWAWIERVSWIVIIIGAVIGWYAEKLNREQAERQSNTLEFMKKYQDPHMLGQRFVLLEPWLQYDVKELVEVEGISARAVEDTVFNMIDLSAGKGTYRDMRMAIFDIVDFYETLVVCLDVGRCERDVANSYFKEYANQFYCLYKPYILKLRLHRELPNNYACGLARFAGDCETGSTESDPATGGVQTGAPHAGNSSEAVNCPL